MRIKASKYFLDRVIVKDGQVTGSCLKLGKLDFSSEELDNFITDQGVTSDASNFPKIWFDVLEDIPGDHEGVD